MCKNKNMGGRCASHTRLALMKQKAKFKMNPSAESKAKFDAAKVDYFSTPSGYEKFLEEAMQFTYNEEAKYRPIIEGIDARRELSETMKGLEASPYISDPKKSRAYVIYYMSKGQRAENIQLTPEQEAHVKLACELKEARYAVSRVPDERYKLGNIARARMLKWQFATTPLGFIETAREYNMNNVLREHANEMKACAKMQSLDPITKQAYIERLVSAEISALKEVQEKMGPAFAAHEKAVAEKDTETIKKLSREYRRLDQLPKTKIQEIFDELNER